MLIDHLDHLVLTVHNLEETCRFYSDVLGMKVVEFAGDRKALVFGRQKINLHEAGNDFKPHALFPKSGSADLCFLSSEPIDSIVDHITRKNVQIVEGPIERTGATGPIVSVYVRDPDGNLIEIAKPIDDEPVKCQKAP